MNPKQKRKGQPQVKVVSYLTVPEKQLLEIFCTCKEIDLQDGVGALLEIAKNHDEQFSMIDTVLKMKKGDQS